MTESKAVFNTEKYKKLLIFCSFFAQPFLCPKKQSACLLKMYFFLEIVYGCCSLLRPLK
jgi:hypothetical protein